MEPAIACLYAPDQADGPQGTGFAISTDLALTAFHCIGNRSSGEIRLSKVRFQFRNDIGLEAEYLDGNPKADFALLRFRNPLPADLRPVGLASGVIERSRYRAIGYPVGYGGEDGPDRFTVQGTVTDCRARFKDGSPALQLLCLESLGELSLYGLSGAPVLVVTRQGESAIGLVRWNDPRESDDRFATGATVFACPIATIVEQVPDIRPFVHEISPIAELATFPFPKVREADCYNLLHVARSEQIDRFAPQGMDPPYIKRANDGKLDIALQNNFFVLISGPSKAGKTRTAYELLVRNLPDSEVVVPTSPESIRELILHLETLTQRARSTVLWLDNLETFLRTGRFTNNEVNTVQEITGLKIVATIRSEELGRIIQSDPGHDLEDSITGPGTELPDQSREGSEISGLASTRPELRIPNKVLRMGRSAPEMSRNADEVIARGVRIELSAEMNAVEKTEAKRLYPHMKFSKGLGESFIAGSQLKQRFDMSDNSVKSVVRAAFDWSRTGMRAIDREDLSTLFEIYFKEAEPLRDPPPDLFEKALLRAREPIATYSAMLEPAELGDDKKRFRVPDYLTEYIATQSSEMPELIWEMALKRVDLPEQYGLLGWTAGSQGISHIQEKAYRMGKELKDLLSTFNLGVLVRDRGDTEEAIKLFRECTMVVPEYAEAHYNLAYLIEKKAPRQAEEHYRKSIQLKPDFGSAHNDYGLFLHRSQRKDEALREYLAAINFEPLLKQPHINLRSLIGPQELPTHILSIYHQLSLSYPDCNFIQAGYGYWLFRTGQNAEAKKLFRKAIELKPDYQEAYNWLGILLAMTNEFDEAEAMLKTALHYDPTDAGAHYNLGYLYCRRGAIDLGEHEYQEAIRHKSDSVEAWYNLGNILREQNQFEEAERNYREAIRIEPNHLSAHHNLGLVLHLRGKLVDAKKEFCFVLNADPNSFRAHAGLGCVLRDRGDLVGARRELRTALKIAPNYRYAQEALAMLPIEKQSKTAAKAIPMKKERKKHKR